MRPGGVVVAVTSSARDGLGAVVVVVRSVPKILDHFDLGCSLVLGVGILRDEVRFVQKLYVFFCVLHGIVDASIADHHSSEVNLFVFVGLLVVKVEDCVGPSRNIVSAVRLSGDDGLATFHFREELGPAVVEGDEVLGRLHAVLHLLSISERVTNISGLIKIQHIGMGIPGVWVQRQLFRVVTVFAGAGFLDVIQHKRAIFSGSSFHR
mmetsp:Transcript_82946/g.179056  ORF Transcript_82946/g.179056 Transcript_82946/m.179056 type:complete len:208 (+) Transcript_82946:551-1174(+)